PPTTPPPPPPTPLPYTTLFRSLAPGHPHSDQRAVPPVPHDGRQLRALLGHRHSPGSHRLPELPWLEHRTFRRPAAEQHDHDRRGDRKSTRLNSSHDQISYAVFC